MGKSKARKRKVRIGGKYHIQCNLLEVVGSEPFERPLIPLS